MKNIKNDPLLLEIQEEINRENMNRFATKYGVYVVIAIAVLLAALAGYKIYKNHADEQSARIGSAIYSVTKNDAPLDEFGLKKLDEASKTAGYKEIALLNKAAAQVENDDVAGAVVTYDSIANDLNADKGLKDLAALNAANLLMNTDPKNKQLEQRISILTSPDNTFKYSAMEMLAAYYMENGQPQKATPIYQKLGSDANVPVTISQRARELAPPVSNVKASANEEE